MPRFQVGDRVRVIEDTQRAPGALRGQTGTVTEVTGEDAAGPEGILYTVRFDGLGREFSVYESALKADRPSQAPSLLPLADERARERSVQDAPKREERRLRDAQRRVERRLEAARLREDLEKSVQAECAELLDLGVAARVVDRKPLPKEEPQGWIEIADSPVRWAQITEDRYQGMRIEFWVPDSRIGLDFPGVRLWLSPIASRIPFKRTKSFRWVAGDLSSSTTWSLFPDYELSSQIADRLTVAANPGVLESDPHLFVRSNLTHGCWTMASDFYSRERVVWNSCEAVARALLAMPIQLED